MSKHSEKRQKKRSPSFNFSKTYNTQCEQYKPTFLTRSKSMPIQRSISGSLLRYKIVDIPRLAKGDFTNKQFVSRMDGMVAKLIPNPQYKEQYDPFDNKVIIEVLKKERHDFYIQWVYMDI